MKREIPPAVAVVAVLVIVGIAAFAYWRAGQAGLRATDPSLSAMPPQVAAELQKRMGGVQPPRR
jgi:hypothetical protein